MLCSSSYYKLLWSLCTRLLQAIVLNGGDLLLQGAPPHDMSTQPLSCTDSDRSHRNCHAMAHAAAVQGGHPTSSAVEASLQTASHSSIEEEIRTAHRTAHAPRLQFYQPTSSYFILNSIKLSYFILNSIKIALSGTRTRYLLVRRDMISQLSHVTSLLLALGNNR